MAQWRREMLPKAPRTEAESNPMGSAAVLEQQLGLIL